MHATPAKCMHMRSSMQIYVCCFINCVCATLHTLLYTLHYPCHMCTHVWRRCHMLVLIYLLTTYFMQALSSRKRQKVVDDVKQIVSADKNFKNYRDQLRTINPPCVPFIGETPYIHAEIHHPCICIWVVCVAISFMHPPLCCRYVLKLDYVHPS